jgi:hypothetical protein
MEVGTLSRGFGKSFTNAIWWHWDKRSDKMMSGMIVSAVAVSSDIIGHGVEGSMFARDVPVVSIVCLYSMVIGDGSRGWRFHSETSDVSRFRVCIVNLALCNVFPFGFMRTYPAFSR